MDNTNLCELDLERQASRQASKLNFVDAIGDLILSGNNPSRKSHETMISSLVAVVTQNAIGISPKFFHFVSLFD